MRFLPAGPRALLIEVEALDEVRALAAEVSRRRAAGWAPALRDVVPGARTLLLDGVGDVAATIRDVRAWPIRPPATSEGPTIELACVYDGPDLADVAAGWGVSVPEAVAYHSSILHAVAFCGFSPGFAYLAGVGRARAVKRRATPRTRVPAGSVALAGEYTGIYPRPSPGGWQLIGRTEARVWDVERHPPALLVPGRSVRFRDVAAP